MLPHFNLVPQPFRCNVLLSKLLRHVTWEICKIFKWLCSFDSNGAGTKDNSKTHQVAIIANFVCF